MKKYYTRYPLPFYYLCIPMTINIDTAAGFCPGVKRAIRKAEKELSAESGFCSLGSLLHNEQEMGRLEGMGLKVVKVADITRLGGNKLLFRAHGEPPENFELTRKHGVEVVDATCGIVRRLQKQVSSAAAEMEKVNGQVIIYGKKDHPEVIGLLGHSKGLGIVISAAQDLAKVDMARPMRLFSQTTMDAVSFQLISDSMKVQVRKKSSSPDFRSHNTICRHVLDRVPALKKFASAHELIIFVSGRESSNGNKLFNISARVNPRTYFITEAGELKREWFADVDSVGISGAASTPQWLMEDVAEKIKEMS
ncbi:MAG: 4-hydroxy-3-methylbut-2-enyl diphosphate reductase [Bacteroidota bacterium]